MSHKRTAIVSLASGLLLLIQGCSSTSIPKTASNSISRATSRSVAAMVDGRPVTTSTMLPLLMEAAGAEVLEEIALDSILQARALQQGIELNDSLVQAEHARLLALLREQTGPDETRSSAELVATLRRSRGLGDQRYRALLERTALLRALAQRDVTVLEHDLRMAYEREHGPRYDTRLITIDDTPTGQSALALLEQGQPFNEVAARLSTHASASTGGAVGLLSAGDTTLPSVVREALPKLTGNQPSGLLALDRGFAIVQVQNIIPGDAVPLDQVRESLTNQVREELVRQRMATLAQQILFTTTVTPYEPGLEWSWNKRNR